MRSQKLRRSVRLCAWCSQIYVREWSKINRQHDVHAPLDKFSCFFSSLQTTRRSCLASCWLCATNVPPEWAHTTSCQIGGHTAYLLCNQRKYLSRVIERTYKHLYEKQHTYTQGIDEHTYLIWHGGTVGWSAMTSHRTRLWADVRTIQWQICFLTQQAACDII